jgi:hypothetical protein
MPPAVTARSESPQPAVLEPSHYGLQHTDTRASVKEPVMPRASDSPVTSGTSVAKVIPAAQPDVTRSSSNPQFQPGLSNEPHPERTIKPLAARTHPVLKTNRVPSVIAQPDIQAPGHIKKDEGPRHSSKSQYPGQLLPRVVPAETKALNPIVHLPDLAGRAETKPSLILEAQRVDGATAWPGNVVPVARMSPANGKTAPLPLVGGQKRSTLQPAQANSVSKPEIHVTIGRVEIRAMPSTAPARDRSKKEPQMSLEAYLQRRAEGGRR